jgi:peptide/nickel transport system substrate-binding protein
MDKKHAIHPAIPQLKEDVKKGLLTRREFLRYAGLLGVSATAASQMIGFTWPRGHGGQDQAGRSP